MMLVRDMVTTDKQSYTLIILATFLITVPFRSVGGDGLVTCTSALRPFVYSVAQCATPV